MNISKLTLAGALGFGIASSTCGLTIGGSAAIAASSSCVLTASFTPQVVGRQNAALAFIDDASISPQVVNMTGTGTPPPVDAVDTLAPNPLDFAAAIGYPTQQNLTVSNTSRTIPLYISSLTLSDPSDFGIVDNGCPMAPNSLAPSSNCTIALDFAPQSLGTVSGNLMIAGNTTATPPETVALSGNTITCPIGQPKGPTPPRANPDDLQKGQDTLVTVTSVVPPEPGLISGSVKLIRVDSSGNQITSSSPIDTPPWTMYDDGTHGDAVAGDGQYTGQFTFNEPLASGELSGRSTPVYLAVQASYSGPPGCRQSNNNDRPIDAYRATTPAEDQAEADAVTKGGKFYSDEIVNGADPEQARLETIQFLLQQPGVAGAAECEQSNCISVEFSSGLISFVTGPNDEPDMGGGSISKATRAYLYLRSLLGRTTGNSDATVSAPRGRVKPLDQRSQTGPAAAPLPTPAVVKQPQGDMEPQSGSPTKTNTSTQSTGQNS
ncbi:MAG TPA: choice-of-anchor D domain-containing protein [Candidatus Binataceae bacterium]|nr:choice-of-anchor D domain-containing protein [Candidatus Binataceae bacterium]